MATLDDLKKLLKQRAGFEVLEGKESETQIRLEGRVPPNATGHFLLVMDALFDAVDNHGWTIDYSKHYFRKALSTGKKFFFAHRVIFQFQAAVTSEVIDVLGRAINGAARPNRVELQEFPLAGAGAHRTSTVGRGAYGVDKAPLGPQSVQRGVAVR